MRISCAGYLSPTGLYPVRRKCRYPWDVHVISRDIWGLLWDIRTSRQDILRTSQGYPFAVRECPLMIDLADDAVDLMDYKKYRLVTSPRRQWLKPRRRRKPLSSHDTPRRQCRSLFGLRITMSGHDRFRRWRRSLRGLRRTSSGHESPPRQWQFTKITNNIIWYR